MKHLVLIERIKPGCKGAGEIMAKLSKADVLRKAEEPKNWGKWGPDDELGVLNYITPEDIRHRARRDLLSQGSG
jgi:hypothetical protein